MSSICIHQKDLTGIQALHLLCSTYCCEPDSPFFLEASTLSVPIWISCSLGLLQSCCLGLAFSVFLGFTFPFSCLEPCFLGSIFFSFWLSSLYLLLPTNHFLKCLNVSCRSKNIFILSSYLNHSSVDSRLKINFPQNFFF